jgi:hypothetical protein
MFGKGRNDKMDAAALASSMCQGEDEGWEVVKSNVKEEHSKAKDMCVTATTADVGTSTEKTVDEEVSKSEMHLHTAVDATLLLEETDALICVKANDAVTTWQSPVVGIPEFMPLQDMLASLGHSQINEQGKKIYFLMKRNLKTMALLLLLGVFCTGTIPSRRSKREGIVPSPSTVDDTATNPVDYGFLIETLKARIVKLEQLNRQTERELYVTLAERDSWRRMVVSCNEAVRHRTQTHSRYDDTVNKNKLPSLAPSTSTAERVKVSELATTDETKSSALTPSASVVERVNVSKRATNDGIKSSALTPSASTVERVNTSTLVTIDGSQRLPAPEPSPPRRTPRPQLALPGKEPWPTLSVERVNASKLITIDGSHKLPAPEPTPPRRTPHPQLALPGKEPWPTLSVERVNASKLITIDGSHKLPAPEPSPPRRTPHPQLALPGKEPWQTLPTRSANIHMPQTSVTLVPSVVAIMVPV